jgi:protein TonB
VVSNTSTMSDVMFREIGDAPRKSTAARRYGVPLSIAGHAVVFGMAIVIPLMAPSTLPPMVTMLGFTIETPPPTLPPLDMRTRSGARGSAGKPVAQAPAPVEAPHDIELDRSAAAPDPGHGGVGLIENGIVGVPNGIFIGSSAPPEPPRAIPSNVPIRVGGKIRPPTKNKHVAPVYPPVARAAHVEGTVILQATIGPSGEVQAVTVLRSIPLLDAAAIEAVRQWEFTPTLLNGVPVAVIMTVTVMFTLR